MDGFVGKYILEEAALEVSGLFADVAGVVEPEYAAKRHIPPGKKLPSYSRNLWADMKSRWGIPSLTIPAVGHPS